MSRESLDIAGYQAGAFSGGATKLLDIRQPVSPGFPTTKDVEPALPEQRGKPVRQVLVEDKSQLTGRFMRRTRERHLSPNPLRG